MTSSESSDLKYTGSLELKDGMIHLVHDQALPPHYGGYHPRTNTVFYGGTLEMADPLTLRMSQRDIRIQDGERVEVVSKVAEQCDAWHTLIEHDDAFIREIQALMTEQRVINPDTLGMIGTEAARQYVSSDTTQRPPGIPVRLQLAEGVGLRSLPRSGWKLQVDGSITDKDGAVLYYPAAAQPLHAAPAPVATAPVPARTGLLDSLRRMFGGS